MPTLMTIGTELLIAAPLVIAILVVGRVHALRHARALYEPHRQDVLATLAVLGGEATVAQWRAALNDRMPRYALAAYCGHLERLGLLESGRRRIGTECVRVYRLPSDSAPRLDSRRASTLTARLE